MPIARYQGIPSRERLRVFKVGFKHVHALEAIEARSQTVPNEQISFHIELQRVSSIFIAAALLPPAPAASPPRGAAAAALRAMRRIAFSIAERREPGNVAAFAGISFRTRYPEVIVITTDPQYRRRGIAELLMLHLIQIARRHKAERLALEVRKSNTVAQQLYRKHLYEPQRILPKHYTDNDEDAIYMHTPPLEDPDYQKHLRSRWETLAARWETL